MDICSYNGACIKTPTLVDKPFLINYSDNDDYPNMQCQLIEHLYYIIDAQLLVYMIRSFQVFEVFLFIIFLQNWNWPA